MKHSHLFATYGILIFFCCFQSLTAQSGPFSLHGKISDEASGTAVDFASVALLQASDSATVAFALSDSSGTYQIDDVPGGEYFLVVNRIAYQDFREGPITIDQPDQSFDIIMQSLGETLEAVEVRGAKPVVNFRGETMTVDVQQLVGVASSNGLEILERIPGVWVEGRSISLNGESNVTILINGRQKTMSASQVASLLESLPATSIKSIEVINGKSVEYDAAGSGGVLNIITDQLLGQSYNLNITNRLTIDRYLSNSHNAYLNWNANRIQSYASIGFNRNYSYSFSEEVEQYTDSDGEVLTDVFQRVNRREMSILPSASAGLDYQINDNSVIGFSGSTYFTDARGIGFSQGDIINSDASSFRTTLDSENEKTDNLTSVDLFYENTLDNLGSKLKFTAGYINGFVRENPVFTNRVFVGDEVTERDFSTVGASLPLDGSQYFLQGDYLKKLGPDTELKIGVKYTDGEIENFSAYDSLHFENPVRDQLRSDSLSYAEKVLAGYFSFEHTMDKLTVEAGVRAEQTWVETFSFNANEGANRNYINWFPNLTVSYNASRNFKTSLNFNTSIERPNYLDINPYERYIDQFTVSRGNNQLNPKIRYRIMMSSYILQFLSVNLGYTYGRDYVTNVRNLEEDGLLTVITPENAYDSESLLASVTAYYALGDAGRFRGQLNGLFIPFRYILQDEFSDLEAFAQSDYILRFSNSNSFKLTNALRIEQSFRYIRGREAFQVRTDDRWTLDFGFRFKPENGNITIGANITDIFNTYDYRGNIFYDGFDARYLQDFNSRRLTLSATVNFGKLSKDYQKDPSEDIDRFRN